MSEGFKAALPEDWLVLAIFGIIVIAGAMGYSLWFIVWGAACLSVRDIVHYWDIVHRAWRLPGVRAILYVAVNLVGNAVFFAVVAYSLGHGLYIIL